MLSAEVDTKRDTLSWSGELIEITARRYNKDRDEMFWTEVSMLSSLKHQNLVSLVGFCYENGEKIIITTDDIKGSLSNYLSDATLLTWVQRLKISVGLAHALSYIHYDESRDFSVIHRDISSITVLLNDNYEPKLSCFENSMKIEACLRHRSFHTSKVWRRNGYTDPTYEKTKSVNHKTDIYSFGVVLFELLCGRESIIADDTNRYLAPTANLLYKEKKLVVDWDLWKQMDPQSFNVFVETTYDCLNEEQSQRPSINEIVTRLEKVLELQLKHQNAPGTQDRRCGYFMWKDDLRLRQSSSPGPSTPLSSYPGPSTCPSYYPEPSGSAASHGEEECLNCKFLAERIKILKVKINILEGTLEMERHPENHTFESTAILHELYNNMGRLGLETSSLINKKRTIDSFYKPIKDVVCEPETVTQTQTENQTNGDNIMEESPRARVEPETNTTLNTDEVKLESLIRDPGVRPPLSSYPSNQQDEIRRTYIRLGPYQLVKAHYPLSPCGFHKRRFQAAWFRRFGWLEYFDNKDATFCFSCYLFGRKPIGRAESDTFTVKGFNNWRKVNSGTACPFVNHECKTPALAHNFSVRCYEDLKNKVCHIENVIDKQTEQEIMDNRLRLKVTIDSTKWLTLQTCPLRGGDERPTSLNRGNYLELVKLLALYNKDVARVLENAPKNAKYTSPDIQKELL
ncbi:kinase-like domain, phloem protein 2-like protein [Tanacetum coccineum]